MKSNVVLKLVPRELPRQTIDRNFEDLRLDPSAKEIVELFFNGATSGERIRPNFTPEVRYVIEGDLLLRKCNYLPYNGAKNRTEVTQFLARRFDGFIVGNSSGMGRMASPKWGGRTLKVQECLSKNVPMIPFRVLEENKLDLNKFELLDFGGAEYLTIEERNYSSVSPNDNKYKTEDVTRHFAGACLFKIDGSSFLFDVDRQEIKNKIFNPFLSKLPSNYDCRTIAEAYDSLKPEAVRSAESRGETCFRHGEWFFIPAFPAIGSLTKLPEASLHNGLNASHRVSKWDEENDVVTGKVDHRWGPREHKDLWLDSKFWYKAIPNTATESYKITGRID